MAKAVSKKDVDFLGIFPLLPDETIEYTPERWSLIENPPVFELRGSSESESATKRKMQSELMRAKDGDLEKGHKYFVNYIFCHIVGWKSMYSSKGREIPFSRENFDLLINASPVIADDLFGKIAEISQLGEGIKASLK
jgi:hypothetical protein